MAQSKALAVNQVEGVTIYRALKSQTLSNVLDSFSFKSLSTPGREKSLFTLFKWERPLVPRRDLSLKMFEELEVLNRGFLSLKCSLCVRGYLNVLWEEGQNLSFSSSGEGPLTSALPLILRWSLCVPACPAGMFKASQEAEGCSHCPSNSRSPSEASPICTCRTGYYRADFDPPEVACTSKCLVKALG